jgi:hypothetical protein
LTLFDLLLDDLEDSGIVKLYTLIDFDLLECRSEETQSISTFCVSGFHRLFDFVLDLFF